MRPIVFICLFLFAGSGYGQSNAFPDSWIGTWKGELNWYKGPANEPQKVAMELRIHPADSVNKFSWKIIYGSEVTDSRPYMLIAMDTAKGHWVIDEQNGILLDQFYIAGKLCGTFTVGGSTILSNYWLEHGRLLVEYYGFSAKPVNTTGKGTEESPAVDSYKMNTYQKAILTRQR